METKDKLRKERIVILQTMAEAWLKRHGRPSTEEKFKIEDKFGELNGAQAYALHFYLLERYKKMGLDLIEEIKKKGEEVIPGTLAQCEWAELVSIADEQIVFLATLGERIEEFKKNK